MWMDGQEYAGEKKTLVLTSLHIRQSLAYVSLETVQYGRDPFADNVLYDLITDACQLA